MRDGIIFYDSYCGMCDYFIRKLLKWDKSKKVIFAPIGGITFKELGLEKYQEIDSVIYYTNSQVYFKSNALIKVSSVIGGPYSFLIVANFIPRPLRDYIYDLVAKNRKRQVCDLSLEMKNNSTLRDRFLP